MKFSRALLEESTVHPLPTLFKLLELKPVKKVNWFDDFTFKFFPHFIVAGFRVILENG